MKVTKVGLNGFRAFAQEREIDLDADAIIIVGPNGSGKTSLLDGILWVLSGRVPRLGSETSKVISMYSSTGEARVAIEIRASDGQLYRIVRSFDGQQGQLRFESDGVVLRHDEARVRLLKELWPDALATPQGEAAFAAALTRGVYLQQDLVRQFVEADTEEERFAAASELTGAGRVNELQMQLDRARTAWTRATTMIEQEVEPVRRRLHALERELSRIGGEREVGLDVEHLWPLWWEEARRYGIDIPRPDRPSIAEAPRAIDGAIRQLEAVRQANDRRHSIAVELLSEVSARTGLRPPDAAGLERALVDAERELERARQRLAEAHARAAEERRLQTERREMREELRTLATLALRHLGDRCPVCTQAYDAAITRAHLEALIRGGEQEAIQPTTAADVAAGAARELALAEQRKAEAEADLRRANEALTAYRAWTSNRDRRLNELGVRETAESEIMTALERLIVALADNSARLQAHREHGEHIALDLARAVERARRAELEREAEAARIELQRFDQTLRERGETGALAVRILEGLREAASEVVQEQVARIEPLLQRIYAGIDSHPTFREVRFRTWFSQRRGRLATRIEDLAANVRSEEPGVVLSSSQMNALAVAVFLAFNLGAPAIPLTTAVLDDPLQSLDDVNLLGLVDLLRRTRERRQVILSTHDVRFARLLSRKLRPIRNGQRTLVIEFEGWSRGGPNLAVHEIAQDREPLRIGA